MITTASSAKKTAIFWLAMVGLVDGVALVFAHARGWFWILLAIAVPVAILWVVFGDKDRLAKAFQIDTSSMSEDDVRAMIGKIQESNEPKRRQD